MSFLLLLFPALFGLLLWDAAQDNDDSPSDSEDEITGQGNDPVEGAGTDDLIRGYDGDDSLTGGDGDDTLSGGEGFDIVLGGAGNDVVKGGDEFDLLGGGAGDDSVFGNDGDDFLDDEVGTDYLDGGNGDDIIVAFDNSPGAGGPDTLVGGRGNDILWGDDGDFLIGGAGGDEFEVIAGQEGAEPVVIRDLGLAHSGDEETRDRVNFVDLDGHFLSVAELAERGLSAFDREDGTGTDILLDGEAIVVIEGHSASALTSRTSWIGNFSAGNSARYDDAQELTGTSRDDDIEGGGGDDTIFGGGGIDFLDGGTGDDLLLGDDAAGAGGAGDLLLGGEGDDTLRGDEGDFLTGEEGRDGFVRRNLLETVRVLN